VEAATNGLEALEMLATLRAGYHHHGHPDAAHVGNGIDFRCEKRSPNFADSIVALSSLRCGAKGPAQDARADFSILKDIDIEAQLESTLAAALGS